MKHGSRLTRHSNAWLTTSQGSPDSVLGPASRFLHRRKLQGPFSLHLSNSIAILTRFMSLWVRNPPLPPCP